MKTDKTKHSAWRGVCLYSLMALLTGYAAFHSPLYTLRQALFSALLSISLIGLSQHVLYDHRCASFRRGVAKTMQALGKIADGGATALLYLMVPFSLITAYGAYRTDHLLKAAGYVFGSVLYLMAALIYNRTTRRWFLMRLGNFVWYAAVLLHIRLGRFDHVVFGWMIGGHKGKHIN